MRETLAHTAAAPQMTPISSRLSLRPSLSCVMPAYNEANNLLRFVPEVIESLYQLCDQLELIIVNDGSKDRTADVVLALTSKYPEVVLVDLTRNFGKEAALTAGLVEAKGDLVLVMDADGQHPLDLVPQMLALWREGSDVVYAVRETRDDQTWLHALFAKCFYGLVNYNSRVQIPENAGDFRLMDQAVVQALNNLPETNRFMKGLYAWVGFKSTALSYAPLPRTDGVSNFGFKRAASLALTGLVAFSSLPLRLFAVMGGLISAAALIYGCWVVMEHFIYHNAVPGYATLAAGMMFFSGIQLMSIGVLAEYVARIYEEVKHRPIYLLKRRHGRGLVPAREPRLPAANPAQMPLI
jgi:polyisoprenyl-phosphate glycosyltransferase